MHQPCNSFGCCRHFFNKNNVDNEISDSENDDDEAETQFNSFVGDQNLNIDSGIDNIEYSLEDANINEILKNFRKTVRFFRKSPVRNDMLYRYVEEKEGKKLKL